MNGNQLRTILWLRWRLTRNQLKRGGALGAVIGALAGVALVVFAVGACFHVHRRSLLSLA